MFTRLCSKYSKLLGISKTRLFLNIPQLRYNEYNALQIPLAYQFCTNNNKNTTSTNINTTKTNASIINPNNNPMKLDYWLSTASVAFKTVINEKLEEAIKTYAEDKKNVLTGESKTINLLLLANMLKKDEWIHQYKRHFRDILQKCLESVASNINNGKFNDVDYKDSLKMCVFYTRLFLNQEQKIPTNFTELLLKDSKQLKSAEFLEILVSARPPPINLTQYLDQPIRHINTIISSYSLKILSQDPEFLQELDNLTILRGFIVALEQLELSTNPNVQLMKMQKDDMKIFFGHLEKNVDKLKDSPKKLYLFTLKILYYVSKSELINLEETKNLINLSTRELGKETISSVQVNFFSQFTFYASRMSQEMDEKTYKEYCTYIMEYTHKKFIPMNHWKSLAYTLGLTSIRTDIIKNMIQNHLNKTNLHNSLAILQPNYFISLYKNVLLCAFNLFEINNEEIEQMLAFIQNDLKIFDKDSKFHDGLLIFFFAKLLFRRFSFNHDFWKYFFEYLTKYMEKQHKNYTYNHDLTTAIGGFEILLNSKDKQNFKEILESFAEWKTKNPEDFNLITQPNKISLKNRRYTMIQELVQNIENKLKEMNIQFKSSGLSKNLFLRNFITF